MKKIKNKKGFTLIELLAAVVILGILMLVAIPRVSKYIENSRKDAFIDTALVYIQAVKYGVADGSITCQDNGYIVLSSLKLDKGKKSSLSNSDIDRANSYVQVKITNGVYSYKIAIMDKNHNGWDSAIDESELDRNDITKDAHAGEPQGSNPSPTACSIS